MIKFFVLRLAIFGLVAAVGSFFAIERFGYSHVPQKIAKAVAPAVSIAELVGDPSKYDESFIQVTGRLAPHARLGLLGFGGVVIEDDAGHRLVVLTKNGLPVAGPDGKITAVGVYRQLFEVGPLSYPVLLAIS